MSELVLFLFSVLITAGLLAKVEINIEGAYGYAEKLPVEWRTNNKWMRLFLTGTSYHLYMGLFLLAMLHSVLLIEGWTLRGELMILSYLAFVTVAEDFLWFVFNPAYGLKKFKRREIAWFKDRWFLGVPVWYHWYIPSGVILYWLAQL